MPWARTALSRCSRVASDRPAPGPSEARTDPRCWPPARPARLPSFFMAAASRRSAAVVERRRNQRDRADGRGIGSSQAPPESPRARRRRSPPIPAGRWRATTSHSSAARTSPTIGANVAAIAAGTAVSAQIDRERRQACVLQTLRHRRPIRPSTGPACARARRRAPDGRRLVEQCRRAWCRQPPSTSPDVRPRLRARRRRSVPSSATTTRRGAITRAMLTRAPGSAPQGSPPTAWRRPTNSARLMRAWPIDTSSR